MTRLARRTSSAALAASGALVAGAPPAAAHGGAADGSLPFAAWQLAWATGAAAVVAFAVLALTWGTPRLARAATGQLLPAAVDSASRLAGHAGRVLALAVTALLLATAFFGPERGVFNVAALLLYLVFWIGVQALSPVLGDIWGTVSPIGTLARLVPAAPSHRATPAEVPLGGPGPAPPQLATVLAPTGLLGLAWLLLAYHSPSSPRLIGGLTIAYVLGQLGLVARYGRAWLRQGESFAVYFGLLAALAPFHRDGTGRLRIRVPVAGLAATTPSPVLLTVVVSALGTVSFDGISRLPWWLELTADRDGWALTLVNTIGLAWMVAVAAALYLGAARMSAWLARRDPDEVSRAFAPALAPLGAALTVAHYIWPVVIDAQNVLIQLSDPFARGWDLLGTGDWFVDYALVSPSLVAWVQVLVVAGGHVAAVVALYDRALERDRPDVALRAQYPLVALVVASAVVGMLLVLTA